MAEVRFVCPECGARLLIEETGLGTNSTCPTCGKAIHVPDTDPALADTIPIDESTIDAICQSPPPTEEEQN